MPTTCPSPSSLPPNLDLTKLLFESRNHLETQQNAYEIKYVALIRFTKYKSVIDKKKSKLPPPYASTHPS